MYKVVKWPPFFIPITQKFTPFYTDIFFQKQ